MAISFCILFLFVFHIFLKGFLLCTFPVVLASSFAISISLSEHSLTSEGVNREEMFEYQKEGN